MNDKLTADRLRELVRYEDGRLYWRNPASPWHSRGPIGSHAGHGRRLQAVVDGRAEYVHRLVWLYHHGVWPTRQIDHIDGDKLNNRIENLREVTNAENAQNRRVRGVTFESRAGKWRARIMVDGHPISLGYFDNESDALAEYQRAKLVHHDSFVSGIAATS